jgi:RNA polymerase sigma-70 factor (ECF subfamily)
MSTDELEFEQIFAAFRPRIHRYLIRMVGEYEAEDLTQEVFLRVNQGLKTFRGESKLSTWIYRVATNAAVDRLRSPSYQRTVQNWPTDATISVGNTEIGDRNTWTGETAPLVEQQVYRHEMNNCILNYIHNLPETYRTVLLLSEFEDLSNNAIAEILGVTLETVKIRLYRARERLKEELTTNCGSEWIEGNEFVPELKRPNLHKGLPVTS